MKRFVLSALAVGAIGLGQCGLARAQDVPVPQGRCAMPPGEKIQITCPNTGRHTSITATDDENGSCGLSPRELAEARRACGMDRPVAPHKPAGPSAAEEVEKEHEKWLKKEQEAKEKAKVRAEKQKEFNEDKNKALHSMKGIYVNDNELKGVGDAGSTELKGVGGLSSTQLKSVTDGSGAELKTPAPTPSAAATRMAAICNRRAALGRQQTELAQEVPAEQLAIRDLQQELQRAAVNSEYWGGLYGSVHKDDERISWALDKLDPLATALKHAKVPNPEAPAEAEGLPFGLNELDEYIQIAKVAAQSADAITGFVASGKVRGIDRKTLRDLRALRNLSNRLREHLVALRRVNKGLGALPACDSTELVR